MSRALVSLALAALVTGLALPARAELASWDQEKVSGLAKQLREATHQLYDTFLKQPKVGAGKQRDYYRLKQDTRHLKNDARALAGSLEKGGSREETLPMYEDLMQTVRRARDTAAHVFTTQDVAERASTARELLNQIAPYYDPDAKPLQPLRR